MANILIVSEKPSVGKAIAGALEVRETVKHEGYIEGYSEFFGLTIWVTWAVGHLVQVYNPDQYDPKYSKWSYGDLPILPKEFKYGIIPGREKQFQVVAKLMNAIGESEQDKMELSTLSQDKKFLVPVSEIINACDAGREGELIFRLVYEMSGCTKPVRRLWLSSMEENAIREGLAAAEPSSRYDSLYQSALCRQRADWLVGINGTRLFTTLYGGRILKVGRVQTPVLAMAADREKEIAGFERMPYYSVHISCGGMDAVSGRMEKGDAETLAEACRDGKAVAGPLENEDKALPPPKLYDLTALQRDADRIFGFTAKQTLEYLQCLYEKKLATYPRTDSRYLTVDMGNTAAQAAETAKLAFADIFAGTGDSAVDVSALLDSRKVSDHHALIPTREAGSADLSKLSENERKILALVACRLLCAAGEKHLYRTSRVELSCSGQTFMVSGRSVVKNGWKDFEDAFRRFYRASGDKASGGMEESALLPALVEGQELDVMRVEVKEHYTQPPKRFTDGTLLAAMERAGSGSMTDSVERRGLGTPATRADVIEKLVADGFIKREKKQLIPTKEGMELAAVLPDAVKSAELTAKWENSLALVAAGKMDADAFMEGIAEMVSGLVRDCGNACISEETKKIFTEKRTVLGVCPKCGGQVVKGKYGAYCAEKCGMSVAKYYSTQFTDSQVKSLLDGKKVLLKGLKGRDGKPYDLCLEPAGIEEYSYEKNGETASGYRFSYKKSYPGSK